MAILEARHLSKLYPAGSHRSITALDDVSLTVPRGAFALMAGPSGSGKTTLLTLLGGLERPSGGQALFADRDLGGCSGVELARLRRRMGFIFQDFALIPGLPVWENITYPLIPRGVSRRQRHRLAGAWLERLGLADRLAARPPELSGGEQQRVAVARALVGRPEVLFADEPTSNLDDEAAQIVLSLLRQAHAEGATIVTSSHDPRLATLTTERFTLQAGRLLPLPAGREGL